MGRAGVIIVAIAVMMGIFSGLNGFYMSSSRLLLSMGRAQFLPKAFASVHSKHNTPGFSVLFTMAVCCICPFFGRQVISWVVDMCSVGTAIGYFFTCACAFKLLLKARKSGRKNEQNSISPVVAFAGCAISVGILLLLVIPSSPAFMAPESFAALGVWIAMGAVFYLLSHRHTKTISKEKMDLYILGDYTGDSPNDELQNKT